VSQLQTAHAEQRPCGITVQPIFEIGDQRLFGGLPIEAFAKVIELMGCREDCPCALTDGHSVKIWREIWGVESGASQLVVILAEWLAGGSYD